MKVQQVQKITIKNLRKLNSDIICYFLVTVVLRVICNDI